MTHDITTPDEEVDHLSHAIDTLRMTVHLRTVKRDHAIAATIRAALSSADPFPLLRALAADLGGERGDGPAVTDWRCDACGHQWGPRPMQATPRADGLAGCGKCGSLDLHRVPASPPPTQPGPTEHADMGETTGIAWCHHTFNAVEGCEKVSAGCKYCYAEARNERFHGGENWGPGTPRLLRSPAYWKEPERWNRAAVEAKEQRLVFAGSLCDVCEDHPDWTAQRFRLARLILATPALTWLLLTKRPENFLRLWEPQWGGRWPENVWAGTTCEDQENADRRIPHLLRVPAAVRFLSVEPQVGPVDLARWLARGGICECDPADPPRDRCGGDWIRCNAGLRRVSWVIQGGESGTKARPFDLAWARSLKQQCAADGVPWFFKQAGARPIFSEEDMRALRPKARRLVLSGGTEVQLNDSHGADMMELPEDLRIREFPQ